LLLAGLNIPGITRVIEPAPTRDHSERMLPCSAPTGERRTAGGEIALRGEAELSRSASHSRRRLGRRLPAVAALIVPGSELRIEGVGVNPMRTGLFELLREMGADIALLE
jgi:3-phosphoshikimate 1-carboxyvinyltransferase